MTHILIVNSSLMIPCSPIFRFLSPTAQRIKGFIYKPIKYNNTKTNKKQTRQPISNKQQRKNTDQKLGKIHEHPVFLHDILCFSLFSFVSSGNSSCRVTFLFTIFLIVCVCVLFATNKLSLLKPVS